MTEGWIFSGCSGIDWAFVISLLGDSMQFSSDKSRINHCLLLAIAMKQVMLESGELESAPAAEYADAVLELMDFTMATLERIPDRDSLRLVE
jgi:hypothetical protein